MSLHDVWQLVFDFLPQKPVCVEPVEENLSTDAGLLVFRQWDEPQEFTKGFAEQLDDQRRDPDHTTLEMVRGRLFGILAGYEDQNDHDALRTDAIFKLLADRLPEDDAVVLPVLLYGSADVALGLANDVERIARALREKFPHVLIRVRADSGYAKPWFYRLCERLDIEYSIGLDMNPVLKRNSEELLERAVEQCEETSQPQRLFTGFDYQAGTWEQPRWVVLKCEANFQGTNRRAVVTNRPGARTLMSARICGL